jgi:AcrR family transcriptional regulator
LVISPKGDQEMQLQIPMNQAMFLRDPAISDLGRKILAHSIPLIHNHGFEAFTFKKLAEDIGTTEAGIYRYFENKHKLLIYLTAWYWTWLGFQLTNNIADPAEKLRRVITLLASAAKDDRQVSYVDEAILHRIIIAEGSKTYLTKHVEADNQHKFFKPYKDLCATIGGIISEYNPTFKYPRSFASTIIEMAHFQSYFMHNLPSLTDFGNTHTEADVIAYLNELVFSCLRKHE